MKHEPLAGAKLPKPVGPYAPGVRFEQLLFVSGQGARDPATGELAGLDVETQTEQALENLSAVLEAGGSSLQNVLRCGVFLTDMRDFDGMNAVYERLMTPNRPARTTVQVAGLPVKGLRVEIDAIAYIP